MSDTGTSGSEDDEPLVKKDTKVNWNKFKKSLLESEEKAEKQISFESADQSTTNKDIKENNSENVDSHIRANGIDNDTSTGVDKDPLDSPSSLVFLNRNSSSERSPARRNTDILDSAEVKDLHWAQRCLQSGSSPEATCQQLKLSVCHIAAFFGDSGILNEILRVRPGLFGRSDSFGRTPIHYAAWEGHVDCLAVLLGLREGQLTSERTGRKNKTERENEDLKVIKISHEQLITMNSIRGESVDGFNKHWCDSSHSCSSVSKILDIVWSGCTPLHIACARVQKDSVIGLLACGADITKQDASGRTPLDVCGLAVKEAGLIPQTKNSSFVRIIEYVIKYGKYRNIDRELWLSKQDGTSPLHIAILFDSKKAAKLYLDIRAAPNVVDEDGQTPLHLAILLRRLDILKAIANSTQIKNLNTIDRVNRDKQTPLQLAVLEQWYDGVCILLDANASVTNQSNNDRNSSLHYAAQVGNLDIADKLIQTISNKKQWIDCKNAYDETPLFVAIKRGNASCVRCFLHEGASYSVDLGGYTVLHKAIESDDIDVLLSLLEIEKIDSFLNITDSQYGMTPLHWAALKNKPSYTQKLIDKGADVTLKTSDGFTPLHIAAKEGNDGVIKVILDHDKDHRLVNSHDNGGWLPFYKAAYHCQRDSIELFLENGSNLSEVVPMYNGKKSLIISIIKNNMPRSADYLNSIFNKRLTQNNFSLDQSECEVTFDYSIIMPDESDDGFSQMNAISSLFSSGTNFQIKKLILHPFIESFLHLKWNVLRWFFFVVLGVYILFVMLLTDITINMYEESYRLAISPLFFKIKQSVLVLLIGIILLLEIPFLRLKKWKYFRRLEGWIKLCSIFMAFMIVMIDVSPYGHAVSRFVVALALLFSWMEITILLSRFPEFGYYFQMFATVAVRVVKVFALFGCFVIIGFSLIFWILIRTNTSFLSPWDSLIKTVVMMTSEFDYSSMVEEDTNKIDQVVVQLFFIIFLVCVPIVLMNLLLALAVSDVKDLEIEGKIDRLTEQVDFLGNLEVLARNILSKNFTSKKKWKVERKITVFPGRPYWDPANRFPRNIVESICENLNERKEIDEKENQLKELLKKVDENLKFIQKQEIINHKRHMEITEALNKLCVELESTKNIEKARNRWQQLFKIG